MTPQDIAERVQAAYDASIALWEAEREAERAREQEQREADAAAWRSAFGSVAVACGVRPFLIGGVIERARGLFELRDGAIRPKPGVMHPRDPVKDYDPVVWLADMHAGPDGKLLFE